MRLRTLCSSFERLAALLIFLIAAPGWTQPHVQTIRIKLVDGRTGGPMANTFMNTWVGSEQKNATPISTDKDGVALFSLAEKDAERNPQTQRKDHDDLGGVANPVMKYADTIRIVAGYVVCQPNEPDYSWLSTMEFPTRKIIQQGIVKGNTCGKATATPHPGEVIIFVRRLTWWEKLKS